MDPGQPGKLYRPPTSAALRAEVAALIFGHPMRGQAMGERGRSEAVHGKECGPCRHARPERGDHTPPRRAPPAPAQVTHAGWLFEDDAPLTDPQAMHRSDFMHALRAQVEASIDGAVGGGCSGGCPYLERWFGYYEQQPVVHIMQALARYAPEAAAAGTPRAAIAAVGRLAAEKARRWAATGEEDLPSAPGLAAPAPATGPAGLGGGQPLDLATRARMEPVLGRSVAQVRIHADARGAQLAGSHGAHAVAVGRHVAFAAGAYSPGTPVGDALLAHELAHTLQQRTADRHARAVPAARLESEADQHALAAVAQLHGAERGIVPAAGALSATGLALQGCRSDRVACSANTATINTAFSTASSWMSTALERCRSDPRHPNVAAALQGAFRTTDARLSEVLAGLDRLNSELSAAHTFYCPPRGPDCGPQMDGTVFGAYVRTADEGVRGGPIYFCPMFFDPSTSQPLTVLHELGHLSPRFIPDRAYYGDSTYNGLSTDVHLTNADSYAVFIYWVVNGSAPPTGGASRH